MKQLYKKGYLLFALLITVTFCSCAASDAPREICDFSDAAWETTTEELFALEGTEYSTYDSVYGGICYTYPKTYHNHPGTVKYMYDDKNQLMCIAWTYSAENDDDLQQLYHELEIKTIEENGDGSRNTEGQNNYGNVWHLESGNIILSTMATSEMKALQYAYLNPDISTPASEP